MLIFLCRRIIKDHELVGYPVLTAAIQSLNDMLTEEPAVQPVFIAEGVMAELYECLGHADVMESESCLNMIPGVLLSVMHHNSGAEEIKRLRFKPLLDLIQIVKEPSLVYFDRVSGITSSIGQTIEDVVRNDVAILPIVIKIIQKVILENCALSPSPQLHVIKYVHISTHHDRYTKTLPSYASTPSAYACMCV